MISLITAFDSNFLIGKENKLPWHYPEDLLFFKNKTFNKNVFMGWNTYESLKFYYQKKKLPFQNIYVAKTLPFCISGIIHVSNVEQFLKEYQNKKEEIIVIGGSSIYNQSLKYADKLYITHILKRHQGDSFFPFFNFKRYLIKEKKIKNELIFATYMPKKNNEV
ncbi:dihydrofolate reductase [Candidatus Phytoplasma luffae]|uniref:dihydrofolate reductase n=1 Tax=Loofah witches'-broom phytoplasma TaxID=35773 RepID=A0A975INR7_LOWBP|nr:dihydrofolate reductase [Candidatus Phytoplasma luffae]QTX03186.1 dihydrofolate reductase [Candidatus Phytoplasma luffae]